MQQMFQEPLSCSLRDLQTNWGISWIFPSVSAELRHTNMQRCKVQIFIIILFHPPVAVKVQDLFWVRKKQPENKESIQPRE